MTATDVKTRVSHIRCRLIEQVPFFGHLLLKMSIVITRDVPTLAVNARRDLFVNPDYTGKLTPAELTGVLCHEVLHPAFLCFERQGERKAIAVDQHGNKVSVWNLAHDYAINDIIMQMTANSNKIVLPKGCLWDMKYRDWSAEEIYDDLLQNMSSQDPDGSGSGEADAEGNEGEGDGQVMSGPIGQDIKDSKNGKDGKSLTSSEKKELSDYWKIAVVEAAKAQEDKGQGMLPAGVRRMLEDITAPKIPWAEELSRWLGENGRKADFTYRRPARRSWGTGYIMAGQQKHGVDDLVILWDTSGSMSGQEHRILSEVIGIADDLGFSLRVICVDSAIHSDQSDVTEPEDIDVLGGGGSDFTPAFVRLVEEEYQGVVVAFTDGYIGVPKVKPLYLRDCLWVIGPNDVDPTDGKWGQVLRVDAEGYRMGDK